MKGRWVWFVAALALLAPGLTTLAQEATPAAGPGCTAGSSGIGDGYFPIMGNGGYDVLHYALDLELDVPAGAIDRATATIDARALLPLCAFNLDFFGLEIDAVAVDGRPAAFERRGQELTVRPAAPIADGAPFTVEIAYHGTPVTERVPSIAGFRADLERLAAATPAAPPAEATPETGPPAASPAADEGDAAAATRLDTPDGSILTGTGTSWYATGDSIFVAGEPGGNQHWYPVNNHPADKATYEIRLTVDDPFAAVANGTLAETIDGDGTTTTVWRLDEPAASYLVTLHAGRLDTEELTGPDGLPIRLVFARDVPEAQRARFRRLPEVVATLERFFGPYPLEAAGATVVGTPLPFALETQTLPIFGALVVPPGEAPSPAELEQVEQVLVHETAHQWFGNSVSLLRWEDIWLNEGLTTYSQALWLEATVGVEARDAFLGELALAVAGQARLPSRAELAAGTAAEVLTAFRETLGIPADATGFTESVLDAAGVADEGELAALPGEAGLAALEAIGVPLEIFASEPVLTGAPGPERLFSFPAVYARGALTVHALRQEIGDDAFFALLPAWADRFRYGNATTSDFVALAEEIAGRDLGAFFDAWLFRPDLPPVAVGGTPTP